MGNPIFGAAPRRSVTLTMARYGLFTFRSDDGIVVVEVRKDAAMEGADVAPALRERLGPEATVGLLALFEAARQDWTADVTTAAVERFERRLTDEMSGMRVTLTQTEAASRQQLAQSEAALRQQIGEGDASLRQEMSALAATLRKEIGDQGLALRHEISSLRQEHLASRFDLLKWSFVFWVGQVIAVAGIVGLMLRLTSGSSG
jgi:hypothetical protein